MYIHKYTYLYTLIHGSVYVWQDYEDQFTRHGYTTKHFLSGIKDKVRELYMCVNFFVLTIKLN